MTRVFAVALSIVAVLGMVAPAYAQAPAPKVTINGLVDFVTNAYRNWSGGACTPTNGAACDVTDGGRDKGWYSRERGVFTITGEVGKAKGVVALELDFTNGVGTTFPGTSSNFDLDTDVAGFVETKWLYVEAPILGPGSIMPFIPVSTVLRAGAQPARGHDYKFGILLSGDIPGVTLESTWAPNLRTTATFVQMREALDPVLSPGGLESYAGLLSVEFEVFKGFTVKPTYAYANMTGGSGQASLGLPPTNGFDFNGVNAQTTRHTIGGDIRWVAGPVTIQPTVYFQFGEQECVVSVCGTSQDVDIMTGIADVIVGFRTGPLNLEFRGMYTPGNKAEDSIAGGDDINYYRPINPGFAYMAGWTEIQTSGVDYATALMAGAPGISLRTSPSYDKYGRIFLAAAADYSLTPALTLRGLVNSSWTAEKVDTDGVLTATGITSPTSGDSRYLGTEVNAGVTYRFAPNVAFDLVGAYMFVGEAMDHARTAGGPSKDADDIYKAVARVRFTF